MPRVSVVIPAYNAESNIEQTVRSVVEQTYDDWELLVADDASTDATVGRLQRLSPPARVVASATNAGPAAARNLALQHAGGELVAFLDADDLWLPQYLERQVARYDAAQQRHGDVGLVACNARILEDHGFPAGTYYDQFRRVEPVTLERLLRRNFLYVSTLVPRSVGEEVGWFATELFGTEDHDLWIRILERGYRAILTREVLATYRRSGGSVSWDIARMAANNRRTYERALSRGRLTPRQRRVARSEIRYNAAMGRVADAAFGTADGAVARAARLAVALPLLLHVAVTRPRHWVEWARVLRSRRAAAARAR